MFYRPIMNDTQIREAFDTFKRGYQACEERLPYTTEQLEALIARVRQERPGWLVDLAEPPKRTRADVGAWSIERQRKECALRICGFRVAPYHRENAISHYEDQGAEAYWRPDGSRWGMMTGFSPDIYWSHLGEVFKAMLAKGWSLSINPFRHNDGVTVDSEIFWSHYVRNNPKPIIVPERKMQYGVMLAAVLADLGL